jgi:hypothetical protein
MVVFNLTLNRLIIHLCLFSSLIGSISSFHLEFRFLGDVERPGRHQRLRNAQNWWRVSIQTPANVDSPTLEAS